jgi:hypothetical protein
MTAPRDVQRIVVLNSFGRGGSGLVWRMIGSSPDVLMTDDEWHVGVFSHRKLLRKGTVAVFHKLGLRSLPLLQPYARRKTLDTLDQADMQQKTEATSFTIKLMDYHLVFIDMIRRSFDEAVFINLVRHPYGQCESLLRSGMTLERACSWYRDVALMMLRCGDPVVTLRFEDAVTRPMDFCDGLYQFLGVRWSNDRRFSLKIKPYGAQRTSGVDVRGGKVVRVGAAEAENLIDTSVLDAHERLSEEQRRAVWTMTHETASRFGYTESSIHDHAVSEEI